MKTMSVFALCIVVSLSGQGKAQDAPVPAVREQQLQVGTCDWSIQMALSEKAFHFARDNRLEGIQFSFDEAGKGLDLRVRKNRDLLRQTVKETGVGVASLGLAVLNRVPLATSPDADQLIMECLETMAKLKRESAELEDRGLAAKVVPNQVLLAFFGKADINGDPERMAVVIQKLKRLAPIAEKHGFVLGIESLLSEADHRKILEGVGSPAVKVYYDTANSARMGYDIYHEIESLGAQNICQIHIKENGALLGQGDIDFDRIRQILDRIKYQGWLIIEGSTPKGMSRQQSTAQNAVYALGKFAPKPAN